MNTKTINLSELRYSTSYPITKGTESGTELLGLVFLIDEQDLQSEIAHFLRDPKNEKVKFRFIGDKLSTGKILEIKEFYIIDNSMSHKKEIRSHLPGPICWEDIRMREASRQDRENAVDLDKCDLYYFTEIKR